MARSGCPHMNPSYLHLPSRRPWDDDSTGCLRSGCNQACPAGRKRRRLVMACLMMMMMGGPRRPRACPGTGREELAATLRPRGREREKDRGQSTGGSCVAPNLRRTCLLPVEAGGAICPVSPCIPCRGSIVRCSGRQQISTGQAWPGTRLMPGGPHHATINHLQYIKHTDMYVLLDMYGSVVHPRPTAGRAAWSHGGQEDWATQQGKPCARERKKKLQPGHHAGSCQCVLAICM